MSLDSRRLHSRRERTHETEELGSQPTKRGWRRFRYLIDIFALLAITWLVENVVGGFVHSMQTGFLFDAIGKMVLVAAGFGLVWWRGENLGDVGLKRPQRWIRTIAIGIGCAAVVFIAIHLSEKAGYHRDLSRFKDVQNNLELTIYGVGYSFIGAGFYEEFMFRGFLMQSLAMLFGASRGGWIAAWLIQGVVFGAWHAYQNPLGMAITGTLGLVMGAIVLFSGRNLWPAIIGHGLYDASRFVLFYFYGVPNG
jgi:membrane protease YdiL (CAAX protease family)